MGVEALSDSLGGKAYVYVHLVTLGADDTVNERCVCAGHIISISYSTPRRYVAGL